MPKGESRVVGYYTLAAGSVEFVDVPEHLRRRLPRYSVPVAHLGRLTTARAFYEKHGLQPLVDDRLHLYLPLATARELLRA